MCGHTRSGLSLTSQILTAPTALATFSLTPLRLQRMIVRQWMNEIESSMSIAMLKTSNRITGAKLQTTFEAPD